MNSVHKYLLSNSKVRETAKSVLVSFGYDLTQWARVVMYEKCFEFVRSLGPEHRDVLEISAGPYWVNALTFKSYTATQYPDFDICSQSLGRQFDLIIADQVFEHLEWPLRAGRNVFSMLRPGGYFVVTTPFLLRVHEVPIDCSRWTETGLNRLLQECGFEADHITTGSWGSRACIKANFNWWAKYGWHRSLKNEPEFPVVVWAFAQRK